MKISIITLFPSMIDSFINESILKRAQEKKLVEIEVINLRDSAIDDYGTVDDKPYGGGVGMVIRVDVIKKAINFVTSRQSPVANRKIILTSARGKTYKQSVAKEYSKLDHLIIIAGHYEGIDERVMEYVDEEISVGDYVLTGGELPACIIADSVTRLVSGVLKHPEATELESFSLIEGQQLLECPQYTRPEEFKGKKVPEILLSGNHKNISDWRKAQAIDITKKRRPDLLKKN
ncbi:tRNA (guanosine(37)-N1)-methyltransferase TrmD [Candidatus Roizmanbacteria bacterium CG_4_10_14_0_8_um_filter_39_9]|uniref:tRNA (guanine-N(1)-)-methyltransferase n=1 Tax=Candidatus Roizmanbacteria bacterium CG_4_10_14_0_8_um_filter_39_9 TaxID=1974829 RepID=A0A2M7QCS3_9BACT|nr:MAG: tRNA (guanosine(37)-N1)-methyltransferase TrmD [Candidatus Roizmanbacteria bacterium CG_4_10_14_0_8_um_filter_39_9]